MSVTSSNLSLPYIQANQAQKHITHNEAVRILDSLTQLSVMSASLNTPPPTPVRGDRYIVGTTPTDAWDAQSLQLAVWDENAWRFFAPQQGWTAWDQNTNAQLAFADGAWTPTAPAPDFDNLDGLGVGTSSDATNRLAVASDATLLTNAGAGHQVKVNKALDTDTSSLLFQTGWSGRAEMGTAGSDDFEIKVSGDGSTWHSAIVVDADTGVTDFPKGVVATDITTSTLDAEQVTLTNGTTELARLTTDANEDLTLAVSTDGTTFHDAFHVDAASGEVTFPNTTIGGSAFGDGDLLTVDYMTAKGTDLVTNGTGLLGNAYNMPQDFEYDPVEAGNLPASFSFAGTFPGLRATDEFLPIDPAQNYRGSCYFKQEALSGDWSAYPKEDRHMQFMGLLAYDIDKNQIRADQHMRYKSGGVDSLTTLVAPLTPGDMSVSLASAAGWNDTSTTHYQRGMVIFGYKNSKGRTYDFYSRLVQFDLFENTGVDKVSNTINLKNGFPPALGNPDHPNGTWPAGTRLANCNSGGTYKYNILAGITAPTSGEWYKATNFIGGTDESGGNITHNFPPGTAYSKLFWLPNYSNRAAAWSTYPATGVDHKVWFAGLSVLPDLTVRQKQQPDGSVALKVLDADFDTGAVTLAPATLQLTAS